MRVLVQRPIGPPRRQGPCCPTVSVVGLVTLLLRREGEPDDIQGMPGEETLVLVRFDDVIRWRDDEAEVGNGRAVIAKGAERTDLGHGTSRTARRQGLWDRSIVR